MSRYHRVEYKNAPRGKNILSLFFDFYVLNEVWFRALGAEEYGYATTNILPYNKERAIDETFRDKVATIKKEVIRALEASVRNEIRHWRFNTDNYAEQYERENRRVGLHPTDPSEQRLIKLPLETISELYHVKGVWEHQYGGKRWGKATDLLIKLKAATTFKDTIFLIDQIFDLQHNTGFILNKTVFSILECRVKRRAIHGLKKQTFIKPLNFRFLGKIEELTEHCSIYVKGLYWANRNYIVPPTVSA